MARRAALVGMSLLLLAAGCAESTAGQGDQAGDPSVAAKAAFEARAQRVAEAWRGAADAWRTGFVPLGPLAVPPKQGFPNDATKQAFLNGWYRPLADPPREDRWTETIRYADGSTQQVPVMPFGETLKELDRGDPPSPCPAPTSSPPQECAVLTLTGGELSTITVMTTRGEVRVPAWLFAVKEMKYEIARVAVAPSAITTVPTPDPSALPGVPGLVGAEGLTAVDGVRLSYQLGVGGCDENIQPLWLEADDLIIVGGTADTPDGACTAQLVHHPVSAQLDRPVAARPVLDAATGKLLPLPAVLPK